MNARARERYAQTLKHPDTEEALDLWFYRPVGFRCALVAERWGWHPNVITILSILFGVACGVCCYFADVRINLLGIALLIVADIGDSADGQLARLTGKFSRLGRILDGAAGDLWFISIYVALCLRLAPQWGVWIWLLAVAAGAGHALQCAMADYYRNIHLFFVKGRRGSELDDARTVAREYRALTFRRDGIYKFFMFFYKNYTRQQEALAPSWRRLRDALRERYGEQPVPADLAERFRRGSRPLMPLANVLTFNSRAITLCLSLLLGVPWLYFVVELTVGNVLLLCMVGRHERLCRRLAAEEAARP